MNNSIGFIGVILSVITASIMLNNSIQGRMDNLQGEIDSLRQYVGASQSELHDNMNTFRAELREDMNAFRAEIRKEMDIFRAEIRGEMDTFRAEIRDEINIIRSDIKELQSRTSSIEGKLELLIDAWDIAQPSPPAIAKQ